MGDPRESIKDEKDMTAKDRKEYMKGYNKALDDKGLKLTGKGEQCSIVEK